MTISPGKKVLAIGLDSAAPKLIETWVQEGRLPVFKRLMESGSYGRLASTAPALTPPAWTTSVTGVNPGKHNIYDFFRITPDNEKEIVNAGDRRSKAVWNLLDECGGRSLIINLPITYPSESFNGVMVSGMPTPSVIKGFVSPEGIREKVLEMTEGKPLAVDIHTLLKGDEDAFLKDLEAVTDRITRLTAHFMNEDDWDFCMVVFDDLDRLQHIFWHHLDPSHPFHEPEKARNYRDAILTFHQHLEKQIEKLLSLVDDQTLVIIFSDHGMGPVYRNFYINRFFEEQGWLKLQEQSVDAKEILRRLGISQERIRLFIGAFGLRELARRFVPASMKNYFKKHFPAEALELEFFDWSRILDWDKSKAYLCSRTGQGIMINRNNVDDYETFREEIIAALLDLKDPETGHCPIKQARKKEDLFKGPYLAGKPDIFIEPAEKYELQEKPGTVIFEDISAGRVPISANHETEGILFLQNSCNIEQGHNLSGITMADIAPTALYAMGLPIPQDMDGRVITEAFDTSFIKANPVTYSDISLHYERAVGTFSADDDAKIADRLKGLGYLD